MSKQLRRRILRYLMDRERATESKVPDLGEIAQSLGVSEEEISDQLDILDDEGAIKANCTFGGGAAPLLTGKGKAMLEELEGEEVPLSIEPVQKERASGLPIEEQFQWDVFVSHASEDKDSFVRGLVGELGRRGVRVWYDEFTLSIGDSLRRSIDKGLAKSRYGIAVLSPRFFDKEWPQRELDGLAVRERNGQKVILPVWLDVDAKDVARYSLPLVDRVAAKANEGLDKVVASLVQVISPELVPSSVRTPVTLKREVHAVVFSPDGKLLASGGFDKNVRIWDVASGVPVRVLMGHSLAVRSIDYSPDGKYIVTGASDKTVRVWEVHRQDQHRVPSRILGRHVGSVWCVTWSAVAPWVASGSKDRTVRIWNVKTGVQEREFRDHEDSVNGICFSPNGRYLASGSHDNSVKIRDLESNEVEWEYRHASNVTCVCFSPGGSQVASCGYDGMIKVFGLDTDKVEMSFPHRTWVLSIAYSPDGRYLAGGYHDGTVIMWGSAGERRELRPKHSGIVESASYSRDGKLLATSSRDATIRIWDADPTSHKFGECLKVLHHSPDEGRA